MVSRVTGSISTRPATHAPTAIKELVTDANFDCSDEGIVRASFGSTRRARARVKLRVPNELE